MNQTEFDKVQKAILGPLKAIEHNLNTISARYKAKNDLEEVNIIKANLGFVAVVGENLTAIGKTMVKEKKVRKKKVVV
jgi:hypothetical protein